MSKVHDISNALTRLTAKVKRLEETGEIARASCCYEHEKALRAVRKLLETINPGTISIDVHAGAVHPALKIINEALRLKVKP